MSAENLRRGSTLKASDFSESDLEKPPLFLSAIAVVNLPRKSTRKSSVDRQSKSSRLDTSTASRSYEFLFAIFLAIPLAAALAIEPHPDAAPNSHGPGEVDVEANVKYIVSDPSELEGIVLDETEAVLVGEWQYSTHTPPYVGIGYLHDQKSGKGEKSVTWHPGFPEAGRYEVRIAHCYNVRRATNTPVTIRHARGETTVRIDQQEVPEHGRLFRSLGVFAFAAGKSGSVVISNEGTDESKVVIADAVQFLKVD